MKDETAKEILETKNLKKYYNSISDEIDRFRD